MSSPAVRVPFALALALLLPTPAPAAAPKFLEQSFTLPGPVAAMVNGDLDRDGRLDLVLIVTGKAWQETGTTESLSVDEMGTLMEVFTVVPTIGDRREAWYLRARAEGGFETVGGPLELPLSTVAVVPGPSGEPVLVLTDEGVAALRQAPPESAGTSLPESPGTSDETPLSPPAPPGLVLVPLAEEPSALAGSGTLLTDLELSRDLDGDGERDLLVPGSNRLVIFRGGAAGLVTPAATSFDVPGDAWSSAEGLLVRRYPLPRVGDTDGDRRPDLSFPDPLDGWGRVRVVRNQSGAGALRFGAPVEVVSAPRPDRRQPRDSKAPPPPQAVYFGDLDGDGRAEVVLQIEAPSTKTGLREGLEAIREPRSRLDFYRIEGNRPAGSPYATLEITGHLISAADGLPLPSGFRDLDGDGRLDLATFTTDFSVTKALIALGRRKLGLELGARIWCQGAEGRLVNVKTELDTRFKLDFDDLATTRLGYFGGDFNADRRADFLVVGAGREVTVHLGQPGCRYPARADWTIPLREAAPDATRISAKDLDGDGRADLAVSYPQEPPEPGISPPIRLDLYLSSAAANGGRR